MCIYSARLLCIMSISVTSTCPPFAQHSTDVLSATSKTRIVFVNGMCARFWFSSILFFTLLGYCCRLSTLLRVLQQSCAQQQRQWLSNTTRKTCFIVIDNKYLSCNLDFLHMSVKMLLFVRMSSKKSNRNSAIMVRCGARKESQRHNKCKK